MNLQQELKERFGYSSFREGQEDIIRSVVDRRDTVAMLPTGTGKSLCYQLPGYLMDGHVLIISPLLSLMQDQVEQMKVMGEKRVIALNSFLPYAERKRALEQLDSYKFIFISPEMLMNASVVSSLKALDLSLYVIDEAHCISQWGPDFRPDYLKLGELKEMLGSPTTLALTATATEEVRKDIKEVLQMDTAIEMVYSVDRGNIGLFVEKVTGQSEKLDALLEYVKSWGGPGVVYFSSKRMAEDVAHWLFENGVTGVAHYHGGMEQEDRILIQQQFLSGKLRMICATSAFGMGVNKEDIRFVIHFHFPSSIEAFLQEIGRAGRDGESSVSVVLYSEQDLSLPLQLIQSELPEDDQIHGFIDKRRDSQSKELIEQLQLTEVQYRFLTYYINELTGGRSVDQDRLLEKVKQIRNHRLQYKKDKLYAMINWLQAEACRREKLLHYFDEKPFGENPFCCDVCGDSPWAFKSKPFTLDTQDPGVTSWEKRLEKLLLG
ncbi:ATP-dependent DNA helicase [Bacillus sp. AFS015802]|uniref:RecQ family ATP-dependent DNA helicase n=1 Tax=Bacillus sp. AFS015802 TaxID=2033486 RepID=UPI000BF7DEAB|nr:ATP-dependent DNA helicase RecQ [Bacillus sp. AFS015802]PFA63855.1 ATP-dependent DNA helicase [Bacillus sp. AFS015802]